MLHNGLQARDGKQGSAARREGCVERQKGFSQASQSRPRFHLRKLYSASLHDLTNETGRRSIQVICMTELSPLGFNDDTTTTTPHRPAALVDTIALLLDPDGHLMVSSTFSDFLPESPAGSSHTSSVFLVNNTFIKRQYQYPT